MSRSYNLLAVVISLLMASFLSAGCSSDGDTIISGDTIIAAGSEQTTSTPLYSANGNNWNDYIKNDGSDIFSATDTVCSSAIDTACIHAAEILSFVVPDRSSCVGLTATDRLGTFNWHCDDSVNPVRFVSTGLKANMGLSDLVNFDNASFKENFLLVWESGSVIVASTPAIWWGNSIIVNNDGSTGADMNSGEIHIVTRNANAPYIIGADKVSLLIKPGVVLTGSATTGENVISSNSRNYVWVEGVVDGTGDSSAVAFSSTNFSVINKFVARSADNGVYLVISSRNRLNNISVEDSNSFGGVLCDTCNYNSLENVQSFNNGDTGVMLYSSLDNKLTNVTSAGHIFEGILLIGSSYNNTLSNITTDNNASGVVISGSWFNILNNITVSNNSGDGIAFDSSSNNILNNISTAGNGRYGNYLLNSSNNYFTGQLKVGNNTSSDCSVSGGTNPGLVDGTCANQGVSDAILTTGISLAGSFVDSVNNEYSLLQADTVIHDVIALPSGNDTYTHTWFDSSTVEVLRDSIEFRGDGIGNDNLLCESGETCLYTPNIAAYQGHGDLVSAGNFTDGTITGVSLIRYETNGY